MIEQERFLREVVATNKAHSEELDKIEEELEPEDAILQSDEPLDEDEILELDDLI